MALVLVVNGQRHEVDADPDTPLLWVLRDTLGLLGTKFGCGAGFCGACTVHINGQARRSCSMSAGQLAGQAITTIEGLDPAADHPLQRSWREVDVPQCGYCQAGQIMAAAALLARSPDPSDAEIGGAMNGNLCRCGTYLRIRQAIRSAAGAARTTADAGEPA
jgi:isoquinoline 1-oxidoreductase alpha subunit